MILVLKFTMKLSKTCPKYISRDYPSSSENWNEFLREVEGFENLVNSDLTTQEKWVACSNWWRDFPNGGRVNESHGRGVSTYYYAPKRFPWAIFGRSSSALQRSVYISIETSDCDVKTMVEFVQD